MAEPYVTHGLLYELHVSTISTLEKLVKEKMAAICGGV